MFNKTGYTCTCVLKKIGKPSGLLAFLEMANLKCRLVSSADEVQCYEKFWNHDEDGKPVKISVSLFNYEIKD